MELRKVTAIFRREKKEEVIERLHELGLGGMTVTEVKGYGEYANLYTKDWLVDHVRIEIFTERAKATAAAEAVMDVAHTGAAGDGVVAILPLERFLCIRTGEDATIDQL